MLEMRQFCLLLLVYTIMNKAKWNVFEIWHPLIFFKTLSGCRGALIKQFVFYLSEYTGKF